MFMKRIIYLFTILTLFICLTKLFEKYDYIDYSIKHKQPPNLTINVNASTFQDRILSTIPIYHIENEVNTDLSIKFKLLENKINQYLQNKSFNKNISIFDQEGEEINIDSEVEVDALSLIKLPVLFTAYELKNKNELDFNTYVSKFGYENTIGAAIQDMVIYSNNEATGAILSKINTNSVNEYLHKTLGTSNVYIDHTPGYAGIADESYNQENLITTNQLTKLITLFINEKLFSYETTEEIKELLSKSEDYYNLSDILGENKFYIKSGYAPFTHFAITGTIDTPKYGRLNLTVYFSSEEYIIKNEITDLIYFLISS